MMDVYVIRNKRQFLKLSELLGNRRLPFRIAVQDIYPLRSLESNKYYWGIVLKAISDYTGHTQEECHEAYKRMFNFRYDLEYNSITGCYEWVMGVKSTASLDDREIWDYIMKVRADAELDMHITIQMPNETFVNELSFEHDNIETRRI